MSAEEQQEAGLINEDLERDIGDEVRSIAVSILRAQQGNHRPTKI
jgi:hypothetical protein